MNQALQSLFWAIAFLPLSLSCNSAGSWSQKQDKEEQIEANVDHGAEASIEIELDAEQAEAIQPPQNVTGSYLACQIVATDASNTSDVGCQIADEQGQLDLSRAASAEWSVTSSSEIAATITGNLPITNSQHHYRFSVQTTQALADIQPHILISASYMKNIETEAQAIEAKLGDAINRELQIIPDRVCFYEHEDFLGREVCHSPPFTLAEITPDSPLYMNMTSFSIQGSYEVRLFDEINFSGTDRDYRGDVRSLFDLNFDDRAMSYTIEAIAP